jgi:tetraacyldisaccharide 4'-kinase
LGPTLFGFFLHFLTISIIISLHFLTFFKAFQLNQADFRNLISGQTNSLAGKALRPFLSLAAAGYSAVINTRNFLYDKGLLKIHHPNAAVISIGNITAGGTGKTPLVIRLCNKISQPYIPAILTRGYKAHQSDEVAVLVQNCPNAKIIVNPDRIKGSDEAIGKFGANVLIMDDGFQHRRLHRDLDIVTIDATNPYGFGKLLPAGLLREPLTCLKRADAVVLTRCNQVTDNDLARLEENLKSVNPNLLIARSIHNPTYAISSGNKKLGIAELKNKKIFAFCGIGNPDSFLNTIRQIGATLLGSKIYNDHYQYTANDINEIYEQAERLKADFILTTQKDWAKITSLASPKKDVPLAYLAIELKFITAEDKITQLIETVLAGKIHKIK